MLELTLLNFYRIDSGFPDQARVKFEIELNSLSEKTVETTSALDAATETATNALLLSTLIQLVTQGSLA